MSRTMDRHQTWNARHLKNTGQAVAGINNIRIPRRQRDKLVMQLEADIVRRQVYSPSVALLKAAHDQLYNTLYALRASHGGSFPEEQDLVKVINTLYGRWWRANLDWKAEFLARCQNWQRKQAWHNSVARAVGQPPNGAFGLLS